jgi:probable rRNA maturation factor
VSSAHQQPEPLGTNGGFQDTGNAEVDLDPGSDYLITVQIAPQYEGQLDAHALDRLAVGVLRAEGVTGPLELGVCITTDHEVRTLNRDFLGHDYDTDVISFGMSEGAQSAGEVPHFVTPAERPAYLGDIAISYDRAAEQAPEFGNSTHAEVATLLIHGLLHLLGYDDRGDSDREKMHSRQQQLLETLYDPEM